MAAKLENPSASSKGMTMGRISIAPRRSAVMAVLLAVFSASHLSAATCVNKFLHRSEGPKQIVTLLTGKLTYQEAFVLAQAINSHQAPPLEWVDEKGKTIARLFGEVKVLRPMPVACDDKPSGVVMQATFMAAVPPSKKMYVKMDPNTTVAFDEQTE